MQLTSVEIWFLAGLGATELFVPLLLRFWLRFPAWLCLCLALGMVFLALYLCAGTLSLSGLTLGLTAVGAVGIWLVLHAIFDSFAERKKEAVNPRRR